MSNKTQLDEELEVVYPKEYHVFLLNDDYSTMDFVIEVLMTIFNKSFNQANAIMLQVHEKGKGLCGTYSFEIAETKVMQVRKKAKEKGFPLKATLEEA